MPLSDSAPTCRPVPLREAATPPPRFQRIAAEAPTTQQNRAKSVTFQTASSGAGEGQSGNHRLPPSWPMFSTARNASCGTSTDPTCFIRFLPAFCFSISFRLRVMSPP